MGVSGNNLLNQKASLPVMVNAMYSASHLEVAMMLYFQEYQLTSALLIIKTYAPFVYLSLTSPAQSNSL